MGPELCFKRGRGFAWKEKQGCSEKLTGGQDVEVALRRDEGREREVSSPHGWEDCVVCDGGMFRQVK